MNDLDRIGATFDLLPIPAALVIAADGDVSIQMANRPFRQAGLGSANGASPLISLIATRITKFVQSDSLREDFPWQFGDAVDCRYYQVTLARLTRNAEGRCLVTLIDQTSELRTEHNLRREMMTDSLTGLANRAGFSDHLEALIDDTTQQARYAVLIVDLDRFSRVNACLGSMAGDELLITVARRLKGILRAHDVLARTGGDEFGILLTLEDGPGDADHVARRIQGALGTPFQLSDFEIRVACSIGIAFGSSQVDDAEELIRHAQFAVRRSKTSGRAEAYQTQAFDIAREQFGMETALRRALDRGQLRLSFQPICDLATGQIVCFESLARWADDDGTEYSPCDFIPVAEESGLIVPLGRWAIEEAVRTLAGWDARAGGNCRVKLAVNLSAIQLQRDSIAPVVERALTGNGLDGSRLTLELTESALVTDPDRIAGIMHALKGLGTTLAMDDFGTGYSNLAYLQKLPIDILKIDRSFVTGMLADRDKIAIVRAILSLAQALGMQTTAEGIETNELAQTLAALGCTYGQGFVYARPLEADAAYSLLEARRN
ncbi:bifunctional diguanylate cyclase/phosphodiesterase [Sphingomonas sp. QA11]|uniref:putative bifunctional diguanylate cyclase/phosphodiesterase n=1 Tax=Sphingomonas sp. QA11 TaxID=2950605 RepID=UPI0023498B86|nr:bifunctional diguanylate cyclase/phosphodiesterase [Sphingomonas sp. QA11]WCM29378.1 bifunctional diguanylate cyclase/phosphodiesterase [Sphingomonas sp. QA11]